jgi:glycosyltransferase involved in cell wall biosynthesis
MKVSFDHHFPFFLAHGGLQIQIEQSKAALERLAVEISYAEFWKSSSDAEIIHFFGRCAEAYLDFAHEKGKLVVMSELLSATASRSRLKLALQRGLIAGARSLLPQTFTTRMAWRSFRKADAVIALTPFEARLMVELFDADTKRVHVVPNGVEDCFFSRESGQREEWLVCTATIRPLKRVVELAEAAILGRVPVKFIGRPYSEKDSYYLKFVQLCRQHPDVLEYTGPIDDRNQLASIYSRAAGFVLLSSMEGQSLSSLEAAGCRCPLLLADLPWARDSFGRFASYCPVRATAVETASILKAFMAHIDHAPVPPVPLSWSDVAGKILSIYQQLLKTEG